MIVNFILAIVSFMLQGLAAILPEINLFPIDLPGQIATFMGYIYGWEWLFPVVQMMLVFSLLIIVLAVEFAYHGFIFIFKIIHGSMRG